MANLRNTIAYIDAASAVGSGVRIASDEILTAYHVVAGKVTVNASVKGEGLMLATVAGYDTARDVALLRFRSTSSGPVAPIPTNNVVSTSSGSRLVERLGYEVAVVAYAPSVSITTPIATYGRIGAIWSVVPGDITKGQIDAPLTDGMSGGGVFNKYGEFLGIVLSKSDVFEGAGRYLSFEEIKEVIADLRAGVKR